MYRLNGRHEDHLKSESVSGSGDVQSLNFQLIDRHSFSFGQPETVPGTQGILMQQPSKPPSVDAQAYQLHPDGHSPFGGRVRGIVFAFNVELKDKSCVSESDDERSHFT